MLENGDHLAHVNGVDISYSIRGQGPLLFVNSPGWGIGATYLMRGLHPLAEHFKLVFVTTRGSGKSTRPDDPGAMGSAQMANDLEQLRLHLGISQIDLLGHSNGGAIAIAYAARYSESVRNLVLVSSQLLGFNTSGDVHAFLDRATEDPRYARSAPFAHQPFPRNDEAFYEHFTGMVPLYLNDPDKHAGTFIEHLGEPPSSWAFHAQFAVDNDPSVNDVPKLARISARTLILVGRCCWICPVAVSECIHQGISESELVIFENTGHFPWIEEPERFFSELSRFLAQE